MACACCPKATVTPKLSRRDPQRTATGAGREQPGQAAGPALSRRGGRRRPPTAGNAPASAPRAGLRPASDGIRAFPGADSRAAPVGRAATGCFRRRRAPTVALATLLRDRPLRRPARAGLGWFLRGFGGLAPPGGRCRDALAPRRCGRGVQEDQRVPPALEGGVMTPAGAAALAALVNLPARPRVPASSGAAGPHDSPGAVRRAVLVLVVGNQLHRASVQTEPAGGDRTRPRFSRRRSARASCRRHRRPEPGSG